MEASPEHDGMVPGPATPAITSLSAHQRIIRGRLESVKGTSWGQGRYSDAARREAAPGMFDRPKVYLTAMQVGLSYLLFPQAAMGDAQLSTATTHSTAWTKTGQDTIAIATPLDSFQTMHTYNPGSNTPFRLDALTLCIIAIVVAVNVAMVFCCARLVFLRAMGRELDPLAAEAAQPAAAAVAEAGEPEGGPGGGSAAGGPRIELTAVTNPNMEMSLARRLYRRSSQEEHSIEAAGDRVGSTSRRPSLERRSHEAALLPSLVPKALEPIPFMTGDIETGRCSAAA
ncbi:hypothetical protein COCOBI_10-1220 [Coccomyxa sp. Obi]|nr:hypothetical protein COCOBI_10-1220 [Coccomyxa sp. Obi]